MGTPYLGEMRVISFNFAPKGWALCNGQLLPINQNQALFSILGTTYGGDGRVNFALPDFRGRVPVHQGQGISLGQKIGEELHTLNLQEMPAHTHFLMATKAGANTATLNGSTLAQASGGIYGSPGSPTTILPSTVSNYGGSQPHENRQPYTVLNIIIALQGIFPSRN